MSRITKIIESQGVAGSLIWIKSRRQQYLHYLSAPAGSEAEIRLRRSLKDAWGHRAAAVVLKKEAPVIRMVLTALTALRSFHLPVVVDVSSIVNQSTATDTGSWLPFVARFWQVMKRSRRVPCPVYQPSWSEFHFSLKAGPQGGPAILSSISELSCLPDTMLKSIREVGGGLLSQKIQEILGFLPTLKEVALLASRTPHGGEPPQGEKPRTLFGFKDGPLRRVVGIPDKEGKTRVIAIGDYWSQTALYPLHL